MARTIRYENAFFETQGERQWVGCKMCGHLLGVKEDSEWLDDGDSLKGQTLSDTIRLYIRRSASYTKRRHLTDIHHFKVVSGSAKAEFVLQVPRVRR